MKMNVFEKLFFSLVASIIINFILGCILTWSIILLTWGLSIAEYPKLNKIEIIIIIIEFFAFLVPWSIYNIYRYHIWKKFKKSKSIYIYTLMIPSFCITFFIIILSIYCYITYDPHAGIFHTG